MLTTQTFVMESRLFRNSSQFILTKSLSISCSWLGSKTINEDIPTNKALKGHVYKKADFISRLSVSEISEFLLSQVLYNDGGVVVLNKPYGLTSGRGGTSIYNSIPTLAKKLGYEDLKIVSIPERYTSGLTLLAANEKIESTVDKCLRRSRSLAPATTKSYLAVTVGAPAREDFVDRFGVTKQRKDGINYELILREWSNNARNRKEVNIGLIGYKKLSCTGHASLLSVDTWLYLNNSPRVYLSDILLSPALGDDKFGPRVGKLFGKTLYIKPWRAPHTKYLPDEILLPLHLNKGEESFIPLHFHLYEMRLKHFNPSLDLILCAPPPKHFEWTCQQLDLSLPRTKPCELVPSNFNMEEKECAAVVGDKNSSIESLVSHGR